LRRSLNGEALAIGVDRLDYSKGLVNRIKAFDRCGRCSRSSSARIVAADRDAVARRDRGYGNLQSELAKLVSDVTVSTAKSTGRRSAISTRVLAGGAGRSVSYRAGRRGDARCRTA